MGSKVQIKKKTPKRIKIKVEQKGGLVFINGKKATLMTDEYTEFDHLGEFGRVCYKWNNIIVKFNDEYHKQSQREIRKWKTMKDAHRKYFSKILDWKEGRWGWVAVLVEEFDEPGEMPDLKTEELFCYLVKTYEVKDIFDNLANNWGIRKDGSLIIYDFGV